MGTTFMRAFKTMEPSVKQVGLPADGGTALPWSHSDPNSTRHHRYQPVDFTPGESMRTLLDQRVDSILRQLLNSGNLKPSSSQSSWQISQISTIRPTSISSELVHKKLSTAPKLSLTQPSLAHNRLSPQSPQSPRNPVKTPLAPYPCSLSIIAPYRMRYLGKIDPNASLNSCKI